MRKAWPTIPLSKAGTWLSGGTPRRKNEAYWGGTIPWIGTKDLKGFDLVDASEHITDLAVEDGARVVDAGAILFVTRGMSLAKEFRVGITGARLSFNQDVKAIVPRDDLDGRFLARFLVASEQHILSRVDTASHGTKRLPLERIEDLPVPLPPLPEQRRIATILDEADALRRKRREAVALLEELQRSAFLEMFGDPVTNPRGWPTASLGDLLGDIQTGWSPTCDARPAEEHEWGVLKLGAVSTGRFVADHKALPVGVEPRGTLEVRPGDVLFSRKNTSELVAAVVFVDEIRPRLMLPDLLFRLVPDLRRIEPRYLAGCLMHPGKRDQVQALAAGSSGSMPGVSKAKLRTIGIPVPSLVQQRRFSAWCERFETLRADEERAIASADDLFHVLLQRAFSGDL